MDDTKTGTKKSKGNLAERSIQELIDIIDNGQSDPEQESKQNVDPIKIAYNVADTIDTERIKNPDVSLLIEIIAICSFCAMIYFIYPYLTADNSIIFSKADLAKAQSIPANGFSVAEMTGINNELDALKKYFEYFKSAPYSLESQGLPDIARGVVFLPIITFVATFVVPPIIALYIIWFVFKYWKMVIEALWGWFIMLYEYGTHLIEGKLGCKWYISMVTGWGCHSPKFQTYFDDWRKKYIEVPSYHEKLAYVDKYNTTKTKYFTIPKLKYFDTPKDQIDTEATYLKEIAIDRTSNGFLRTLAKVHETLYIKPRDQIYKWMVDDNRPPEAPIVKQLDQTTNTTNTNKSSSNKALMYLIIFVVIITIIISALVYLYPAQSNNIVKSVTDKIFKFVHI